MSPKAPSHGQKVDLGQNAPVKQEGAGTVPNESLAAESLKEGGEFTSNEGIHGENQPTSRSENTSAGRNTNTNTSSAPSSGSDSKSSSSASKSSGTASKSSDSAPKSLAGTAPSYVENQYIKASGGPHGKNLKEGIDDSNTKDGLKKALESEPGSQDDPSRLAEQQFQQNQTAAGRDAGPKQSELEGKTAFDALNNETSS
ncbi:hypothetical protein DER46DRAFT_655881 [Fusarium sp. MPI-SDFR-AT-0072]|uniref:Uncharacterized protein n=1 Tax=Fusarium oxysporum f. sp. rapae TaxID=485398 RepID=A0A8J5PFZ1_FUSOX|nr:hypothetical protein Forpe1208_v003964 [Fusarium oxysporum f. sp. rapae]KAH7178627.1 hypothetical protein DER46DRAFT_655881 [Fusarium sp. MPI-SDFR-AT-0072]KAI7758612.1 hypothetical protein LZL87_007003 [Fusarium oxysporum]